MVIVNRSLRLLKYEKSEGGAKDGTCNQWWMSGLWRMSGDLPRKCNFRGRWKNGNFRGVHWLRSMRRRLPGRSYFRGIIHKNESNEYEDRPVFGWAYFSWPGNLRARKIGRSSSEAKRRTSLSLCNLHNWFLRTSMLQSVQSKFSILKIEHLFLSLFQKILAFHSRF